jgi:hypothetical protein
MVFVGFFSADDWRWYRRCFREPTVQGTARTPPAYVHASALTVLPPSLDGDAVSGSEKYRAGQRTGGQEKPSTTVATRSPRPRTRTLAVSLAGPRLVIQLTPDNSQAEPEPESGLQLESHMEAEADGELTDLGRHSTTTDVADVAMARRSSGRPVVVTPVGLAAGARRVLAGAAPTSAGAPVAAEDWNPHTPMAQGDFDAPSSAPYTPKPAELS